MNKCIFLGRICNDPDVKYSADGKAFVKFNFAVNRRFHRDGESDADFFQCVAFGKIAETFEKCRIQKGTKLLIESEVRNNNYTDQNGVKHYGSQVVVNSFYFAEGKAAADKTHTANQAYTGKTNSDGFVEIPDGIDEGLPF